MSVVADVYPQVSGKVRVVDDHYGPELAERLDAPARVKILQLMPDLKERAKTLVELADSCRFLVAIRPLSLDPKAEALLDDKARQLLARLADHLAAAADAAGAAGWEIATRRRTRT